MSNEQVGPGDAATPVLPMAARLELLLWSVDGVSLPAVLPVEDLTDLGTWAAAAGSRARRCNVR